MLLSGTCSVAGGRQQHDVRGAPRHTQEREDHQQDGQLVLAPRPGRQTVPQGPSSQTGLLNDRLLSPNQIKSNKVAF